LGKQNRKDNREQASAAIKRETSRTKKEIYRHTKKKTFGTFILRRRILQRRNYCKTGDPRTSKEENGD
jgi:hypothetical protein